MPNDRERTYDVLLIDDNPADVRLTRELLAEVSPEVRLHVAHDGVQGIAFLRRTNGHAAAVRPDLILLDLNLPRCDGREVLDEVKTDPSLRRIPIVVLSTSASDRDVDDCYDRHANSYVTKPTDVETYTRLLSRIRDYWLGVVTLAEG